MLGILSDYIQWNGVDAVSRDFGIDEMDLKKILPKKEQKKFAKMQRKKPAETEESYCVNRYSNPRARRYRYWGHKTVY